VDRRPFPAEARAIDIGDSHCDPARFHDATGWSPRISLEEGLRRTIDWFRSAAHSSSSPEPQVVAR
jgi:UDP-glucose 4-epimerase